MFNILELKSITNTQICAQLAKHMDWKRQPRRGKLQIKLPQEQSGPRSSMRVSRVGASFSSARACRLLGRGGREGLGAGVGAGAAGGAKGGEGSTVGPPRSSFEEVRNREDGPFSFASLRLLFGRLATSTHWYRSLKPLFGI